jgi:hypothetical protein
MKLRCQICFEWIGTVDNETLAYPMRGFMFKSVDPHHGYEPPFPAGAEWEDFRCTHGPHRPMIKDNEIQTDEGMISVTHVPREAQGARGPLATVGAAAVLKREDISTERTVKNREPIKIGTERKEGYACETCQKEFQKEINLRRHKVMAHKGV